MPENLAIQLENVSKVYHLHGSRRDQFIHVMGLDRFGLKPRTPPIEFQALSDISLDIPRGQRIGIIGRNGAGKTTLLKLICGNFSPTKGNITVDGSVQALMNIGLGFHPEYTGLENIEASLHYNGLQNEDYQKAVQDIIDFCELGDFIDQPFKTYSLGMQGRLQFACATSIRPSTLIVDEILGAGDAYFTVKSSKRMEELTRSGVTLLLVSHAMAQILQFCERVIWIEGGKIVRDGVAREIVAEYEVYMSELYRNRSNASQALNDSTRYDKAKSSAGTESKPIATTTGLTITLTDGKRGYRWASEPGPKLVSFGLFNTNGEEVDYIVENQEVYFQFIVHSDQKQKIDAVFYINIINELGARISRIESGVYSLSKSIPQLNLRVKLVNHLMGAGRYYINFLALPSDAMRNGLPTVRYDLVARFCDFEVGKQVLDYREPAVFYHPAEWQVVQ